jgi:hypothetical protein
VNARVRPNPQSGQVRGGGDVLVDGTGHFLLAMTVREGADHAAFRVTFPGRAPQVVRVELHPDVQRYGVSFSTTALQTAPLNVGVPTTVGVVLGGRNGSITVGAMPPGAQLRYAQVGASSSARTEGGEQGTALQAVAALYVEVVDLSGAPVANPPTVTVSVDPSGVAAVTGAAVAQAFDQGEEGLWSNGRDLLPVAAGQTFQATPGGTHLVARSFHTSCALGSVAAVSGGCGGARVVGTSGVGTVSVDSANTDGTFCVAGAPGTLLGVVAAGTVHNVQLSGLGSCADPAACAHVDPFLLTADQCAGTTGDHP